MVSGPETPWRARAAAINPLWAAQPGWKRFVQAPVARNSMDPAAWLPAMPSACAIARASRPPQTRHGRGSAKRATRAGGMKAAPVMRLGAHSHRQARRDLVAQHHGGQKLPAARGLHLRGGNEG